MLFQTNSVKHKYTVQSSKTVLFQAITFSQPVLIQTIQFSISIVFVYTQSNVKTVLFQIILFSIGTGFQCQNSPILKNTFYVCLFAFYGILTLIGYFMPKSFL